MTEPPLDAGAVKATSTSAAFRPVTVTVRGALNTGVPVVIEFDAPDATELPTAL